MIVDLFLPKKIGNYYIFAQRIAGIEITKTHVRATIVNAKETHITVEQCIEIPLEINRDLSVDQRIINALMLLQKQLPSSCEIHTILPSSVVIYKELLLPFTTRETIAQVIKFEIEPLLPFRLDQTIVNFIITKVMPEEKSSYVMIAAVQKQYIAHHLSLFEQAGITINTVTTDLMALYNLYLQIPAYSTIQGNVVLIDMSLHITRLAFIQHNQLRVIRTINNGLSACAKYVGDQLQIPTAQALEHMLRFGLEKEHHTPATYDAIIEGCTQLWQTIQFTINSFSSGMKPSDVINQGFILGEGISIAGLIPFMNNYLGIPCTSFEITEITNNSIIKLARNLHAIPTEHTISLGAALPTPITQDFTLRMEEFEISETSFYLHQLIITTLFILTIIGALLVFNIVRVRALQSELDTSQQEVITTLHERFKTVEEDDEDVEEAINKAQDELKKEEETWFAFSNKTRFLQYLLELTNRIDKRSLGFVPGEIVITPTTITLKAKVKDIEALKELEQELKKSKLFSYVEPQEKTAFTMRINLASQQGEQ